MFLVYCGHMMLIVARNKYNAVDLFAQNKNRERTPSYLVLYYCPRACFRSVVRSRFDSQDLVLAVIGEMFEEPNVVGIGMAIRSREDLLSVWNEDNSNDKVIPDICICEVD